MRAGTLLLHGALRGATVKRAIDVTGSLLGLLLFSPLLAACALVIWLQDGGTPWYVAPRIGMDGAPFRMVKLRTMVVRADRTGVDSSAADDPRITPIGRIIRRTKLDEVPQLLNVLRGEMSLVGPRPNVPADVARYTFEERELLRVRPGITDFASVVFADEGAILEGAADPDLRYHQLIRPWKSRMGLHYVACHSVWLDVRLVAATLLAAVARPRALAWVAAMLRESGAGAEVVRVARRTTPLAPAPPPGARAAVHARPPSP